jgi:hypothetical protein
MLLITINTFNLKELKMEWNKKEENICNGLIKIDRETAEDAFSSFCLDWDIDDDISDMNEDERDTFENTKRKLIKKIMSGNLIYNSEDESFTYYLIKPVKLGGELKQGEVITIKRSRAASNIGMDKYKEKEIMHRGYTKLAEMISKPMNYLAGIDDIDMKVLQGIMMLFLAS